MIGQTTLTKTILIVWKHLSGHSLLVIASHCFFCTAYCHKNTTACHNHLSGHQNLEMVIDLIRFPFKLSTKKNLWFSSNKERHEVQLFNLLKITFLRSSTFIFTACVCFTSLLQPKCCQYFSIAVLLNLRERYWWGSYKFIIDLYHQPVLLGNPLEWP